MAETVLVHDRQPLDAGGRRAGLRHIDEAGVEIAVLAGDAGVDRIGDAMGDAAPVAGRRRERQAGHLLLRQHVPQAELDSQAAIGLLRDGAADQRIGIDQAPVAETRHALQIAGVLDESGAIDRPEQSRTLEIGGNDRGNLRAEIAGLRRTAGEIRHRDRQRLNVGIGNIDLDHRLRLRCPEHERHQQQHKRLSE